MLPSFTSHTIHYFLLTCQFARAAQTELCGPCIPIYKLLWHEATTRIDIVFLFHNILLDTVIAQ